MTLPKPNTGFARFLDRSGPGRNWRSLMAATGGQRNRTLNRAFERIVTLPPLRCTGTRSQYSIKKHQNQLQDSRCPAWTGSLVNFPDGAETEEVWQESLFDAAPRFTEPVHRAAAVRASQICCSRLFSLYDGMDAATPASSFGASRRLAGPLRQSQFAPRRAPIARASRDALRLTDRSRRRSIRLPTGAAAVLVNT